MVVAIFADFILISQMSCAARNLCHPKQNRGLAAKIERKSFKSVQSVVVFILQKVELT